MYYFSYIVFDKYERDIFEKQLFNSFSTYEGLQFSGILTTKNSKY